MFELTNNKIFKNTKNIFLVEICLFHYKKEKIITVSLVLFFLNTINLSVLQSIISKLA